MVLFEDNCYHDGTDRLVPLMGEITSGFILTPDTLYELIRVVLYWPSFV